MYATLEAPAPHQASAVSSHSLEAMTTASNLYNLDSVAVSSYSHPSISPYNNLTASSLLLPSASDYHHLELASTASQQPQLEAENHRLSANQG
jgi:hypothetical protein